MLVSCVDWPTLRELPIVQLKVLDSCLYLAFSAYVDGLNYCKWRDDVTLATDYVMGYGKWEIGDEILCG